MHGLINRSLQCFMRDTYGQGSWEEITRHARLEVSGFEAMLIYEDEVTDRVIEAGVRVLRRPRETLLEDLGHYLVSHESQISLRRLLRFSGVNFADFVNSLEELPDRARLVISDLEVPELVLSDHDGGQFTLRCQAPLRGVGHIVMGLLRAMADDYGALVLLEMVSVQAGEEVISIQIADQTFNEARPFHLGQAVD
jgi:hypothetical protein